VVLLLAERLARVGRTDNGVFPRPESAGFVHDRLGDRRDDFMRTTAGVWIDHRRAVVATISDQGEQSKVIKSSVERQPGRIAGERSTTHYESRHVTADDIQQRELTDHLNKYYDRVVRAIRDAESILIFGPGEAKGELTKRLERDKLHERVVAVETADKMTDRQISARVRELAQKPGAHLP
jgi:stalled ribosome rescue protein Dom34